MNTSWLLQACVVLAIGVGVVSCSKEQVDQVMNRPREVFAQPAQLIESSSPCQPAGVASTSTPDFCVNLMEIQLSNHDSAADVNVTLVNRRGRRLYLAYSDVPNLTDSSGTKWGWTGTSGIPRFSYSRESLPIDPNAEAQIAIRFRKHGQGSSGPTFSLHGEIAILKVDSRGEGIPNQAAVKRGFNLSGIRIQDNSPFGSLLESPPR